MSSTKKQKKLLRHDLQSPRERSPLLGSQGKDSSSQATSGVPYGARSPAVTMGRGNKWGLPTKYKLGCVKVGCSGAGNTTHRPQDQRPTCRICDLIANIRCQELSPQQDGDGSSQSSAGETGQSVRLTSLLHSTHTHTTRPTTHIETVLHPTLPIPHTHTPRIPTI